MKTTILTLTLGLSGVALAQSPVSSSPVGAIEIQIPAATSSNTPSLTAVSLPFHGQITHIGSVATLDGTNKITTSGNPWNPGEHLTAPKFIRLKSGNSTGRIFPITDNTATQLTLKTSPLSLVSGTPGNPAEISVNPGDKFEIVEANTLARVFGSNFVSLLTGATAELSDNVLLFDGSNWLIFFHDGVSWRSETSEGNQNNRVIPRDSAAFIRRRATTPTRLLLAGTVPSKSEPLDLPGASSRFTGHRLPFHSTLQGLGFHTSTGWRSGASAASADTVQIWNGTTWFSFYHNGTQWRRTGSLLNFDTQTIPLGSGMFVIRQGDTNPDVSISLTTPYSF